MFLCLQEPGSSDVVACRRAGTARYNKEIGSISNAGVWDDLKSAPHHVHRTSA